MLSADAHATSAALTPSAVEIALALQPVMPTNARNARLKRPTYYRTIVAVPTAAIPQGLVDQQAGVTQ